MFFFMKALVNFLMFFYDVLHFKIEHFIGIAKPGQLNY